jgi:hypothetical protein
MAKTEEILERILAADKFAATETTVPETPAETAAPETPPAACACAHHKEGHAAGYLLGIQHATEELATRASVPAPLASTHVTTVDEAMEGFTKWLGYKGEYYQ